MIGQTVTNIVPTLSRSSAAMQISDLVFLRLGRYGGTSFGDHAAVPELAKGWTRRDSLTLAFDLDPRARWHDGKPVTARDVVYSFTRARDPKQSASTAMLLVDIASVQAEGDGRVVIRFSRAYGEQLYDATFHVQILPEHLVAKIPPDSLASSAFARCTDRHRALSVGQARAHGVPAASRRARFLPRHAGDRPAGLALYHVAGDAARDAAER